jgi:hypothetical protein
MPSVVSREWQRDYHKTRFDLSSTLCGLQVSTEIAQKDSTNFGRLQRLQQPITKTIILCSIFCTCSWSLSGVLLYPLRLAAHPGRFARNFPPRRYTSLKNHSQSLSTPLRPQHRQRRQSLTSSQGTHAHDPNLH